MTTTKPQDQFKLTLRDTPSPYISPLIEQLPVEHRPNPLPACASCPASMWRATTSRIECLCRNAQKISWDGRQEPTLFCDGREAAIAKLLEARNDQQ
ncbi:MAG: hypothetical protein ABI240_08840 [Sphingomonas sp.]